MLNRMAQDDRQVLPASEPVAMVRAKARSEYDRTHTGIDQEERVPPNVPLSFSAFDLRWEVVWMRRVVQKCSELDQGIVADCSVCRSVHLASGTCCQFSFRRYCRGESNAVFCRQWPHAAGSSVRFVRAVSR